MSYNIEQYKQALVAAHEAGDTEGARTLAMKIKEMQSAGPDLPKDERQPFTGDNRFARGAAWLGNAVTGRGEGQYDLPSLDSALSDQFSTPEQIKIASAFNFGGDEDALRTVQELRPDWQVGKDQQGNSFVTTPDGQSAYINKPGLDMQDVIGVGSKIAPFIPAARFASGGASLASKAFRGMVGAGATDAGMQQLAGRGVENYDPTQTTIVAGLGGASEFVAPVVGKMARPFKNALNKTDDIARGKEVARQMDIGDLSDDELALLGRQAKTGEGGTTFAGEKEFGFKYTKGQRTGDFADLSLEERLRQSQGSAGNIMRNAEQSNQKAAYDALESIKQGMGGASNTADDAANIVANNLQREAGALTQQVDDAYNAVRNTKAFVNKDAAGSLKGKMQEAVRDYSLTKDLTPASRQIMKIADDLGRLPDDVSAISTKALETVRRQVNNAIGAAKNATDRSAATRMKRAFDDWLDDSMENALFSGDQKALEVLKGARGLRAEYARRFQDPKEIAKILEGRSTKEVANLIYGSSASSRAGAANVARAVKKAMGDNAEGWNAMREMVFLRAVQNPKTGENLGGQAIVANLKALLRGNNKELAGVLYSPAELSKLSRFTQAFEQTLPKGDFARSSGTGERVARYLGTLMKDTPFARAFGGMKDTLQAVSATNPGAVVRAADQGPSVLPVIAPLGQ